MALYRLEMFEPTMSAEVGFIGDGYMFALYKEGRAVPETHGGLDWPIRSLFEVMMATWREIDWLKEKAKAARLLAESNDETQHEVLAFLASLNAGFISTS
jgi:hypothetical protein